MKYWFIAFITLLMASCATSHDEALARAEDCIDAGDYAQARSLCYNLSDSTAMSVMTPSMLCRQAIIYARLSEACDNPDDIAVAAECYALAMEISPDSVAAYEAALDLDGLRHMNLVRGIKQGHENPCDYSTLEFETDSVELNSVPDTIPSDTI